MVLLRFAKKGYTFWPGALMRHISIRKIAECLGVSCQNESQVSGYQIDSRNIQPGELFFALPGQKVDGHKFLAQAKMRGAIGAVVNHSYQGPDHGLILLPVEDVLASLQGLARRLMQECRSKVVGITGSVGKTTTKEFAATLLEGKFRVGKTHLSYNTKLTYPITLLNRMGDEEVLVVELGMTEPGDIGRLVEIAAPDLALITKITFVHFSHFEKGISDIAKYKAQIFSHERTKKCIFDHEFYQFPESLANVRGEKLSFSSKDNAADYFLAPDYFVHEKKRKTHQLIPPHQQSHFLHDFIAAISIAREMNMEWGEIAEQVPLLKLPKMRFEKIEKDGVLFINDAYNANPESMKAALSHLPEPQNGGKRIAVLGMMVDLGSQHERLHREVGAFAKEHIDHLLILGKEPLPILEAFQEGPKPAEQYFDFPSLAERLQSLMRPGDVVLVKASRCVEMEKLFQGLSIC